VARQSKARDAICSQATDNAIYLSQHDIRQADSIFIAVIAPFLPSDAAGKLNENSEVTGNGGKNKMQI
jgi:hypothetical protein